MNKLGAALFLTTILLAALGIFILYETSSYTALLNIGDKYYFVKNQLLWTVLGVIICLVVSKFNYKRLYVLSLPLLILTFVLLILVFLPGIGIELKGAHRWINLGIFVLQPSELLKISLTIYLAAWLSSKEKNTLPAFLILFLTFVVFVALEPDMGTAFIIAMTSVMVYLLSGAPLRELAFIFLLLVGGAVFLIKMEPYRLARYTSFQNFDTKNLTNTSYHVKQILISLGSGGFTGVGPGRSIQKYAYLPENTTDSVFAIYAEEFGFIGSTILVGIFFVQLAIGFLIAARVQDVFAKLLASGIITFIGVQTLVNLGSQAVIIPLTGVPLPFISYGGSSLIINFVSIGILLSIARTLKPANLSKVHVRKKY